MPVENEKQELEKIIDAVLKIDTIHNYSECGAHDVECPFCEASKKYERFGSAPKMSEIEHYPECGWKLALVYRKVIKDTPESTYNYDEGYGACPVGEHEL